MSTKQTFFALKDIKPNPYRDFKSNPLVLGKLTQLRASVEETGFWDNILARIGADGKPEIAYGHHRLHVAKEVLGENAKVGLLIRDMSDAEMIQIMSRENDDANGTPFSAIVEAVSATVAAYAAGKINPELLAPKTGQGQRKDTFRYAPSFSIGRRSGADSAPLPYTVDSIGVFLGLVKARSKNENRENTKLAAAEAVADAVDYLALLEVGATTPELIVSPGSDSSTVSNYAIGRRIENAMLVYNSRLERAERERQEAEVARERAEESQRKLDKLEKEQLAAKQRDLEVLKEYEESPKGKAEAAKAQKKLENQKSALDKARERVATDVATTKVKTAQAQKTKAEAVTVTRHVSTMSTSQAIPKQELTSAVASGVTDVLCNRLKDRFTSADKEVWTPLTTLQKAKGNLAPEDRARAVAALRDLIDRAADLADSLQ